MIKTMSNQPTAGLHAATLSFRQRTQLLKLSSIAVISFLLLMLTAQHSLAQARSSIGIRYGVNKPFADSYKFGSGVGLQGTVALGDKWAIEPSVAYDRINNKRSVWITPTETFYFNNVSSLDLVTVGFAARYYIIPSLYAKLGPTFYGAGGNEDLAGLGIGGNAGVGYQLKLDSRNKFEFSFNTDLINVERGSGNGVTPIASVRIAYAFNFKR